jgi:hypothetical protein
MEPEGSLPCPQESANDPYPKPDESSLHPHNLFHINIILPSMYYLHCGLVHSGSPIKTLYASLLSHAWYTLPISSSFLW